MVRHEEAEQKEVVKKTGNIVRNKKRSNPHIRLSDDPVDHHRHNYLGSSSAGHVHPGSSSVRDAFAMDNYQASSSPKRNYNLRGVDSLGIKSSRIASHLEDGYKGSHRTSHASHPTHDSWTADHTDHKKKRRLGEENRVNSFHDRWNPQSHDDRGPSHVKDAFAMDNYQDSSSPKGNYNPGSNSARHNSLRVVDSLGFKSSRIASHSEDDCESSIRISHTTHPVLDSWTADHADHKRQRRVGEENRVNSFPDRWNPQSHDDNDHRSSSLEGHDPECESPDVASGLRHSHDYHRYDDHTSSTQASQNLVSKSRDDYHKYKHDDHPGSSPAENASNLNNSNRKRRKSNCHDQTDHCEEYHPNKTFRQHVPHFRNKNRNKNIFTNERNFRSGRVQEDEEFVNTRLSTVTIRRAERDEEPFDICRMPNFIAPRELSPPPQSNETCKEIQNLMPGMFLLKKWLTEPEQAELVKKCQELGLGNGGFFQPSFDSGKKMCLRMMCLGVNWNHKTYKYEEIRAHDNAQPPPIPSDFVPLVKRAIEDSHNKLGKDHNIRTQEELLKALPGLEPDVCIVNFYEESGRLGLHQDKDESRASLEKGLPVVSFSIGDTAEFCYGKDRKLENLNKIKLESGDVLIFGGESRRVFHGVSKLCPATAPRWLTQTTSLRPGRLNLTFRQISI